MECSCGKLSKKHTMLNNLHKIYGELFYYTIDNERYINKCCFYLIISSLYTLNYSNWINESINIIIKDNELITIYKLTKKLIETLEPYMLNRCIYVEHNIPFKLAEPEIIRLHKNVSEILQKHIEDEKRYKKIIYEYNTFKHNNEILTTLSKEINTKEFDNKESTPSNCVMCKSFKEIKKDLQKLKKHSYEHINKYHYDEKESKEQIIKLKLANDKLLEDINKLKDTNRTLLMNYCNYTFE
jgi:hypothetical protein